MDQPAAGQRERRGIKTEFTPPVDTTPSRGGRHRLPRRLRCRFECHDVGLVLFASLAIYLRLARKYETTGGAPPCGGAPPVSTRSLGRPGYGVGHRQRTLDPDTMLMSSPEITWPFTRPGERAIFRFGASKVPSTIALQHPVPPPPPEKATCSPDPMMLYSTAPGCTPAATRI